MDERGLRMKCNHMHKDDPEYAVCEDCYKESMIKIRKNIMKGGKNGKNN